MIGNKLSNYISDLLKNSLFKNSYFILTNSVFSAAFGFIFWIIASKFYFPSDIGYTVTLISLITLVTIIARFGIDQSIIRFFSKTNDASNLINTCYSFIVLTTLAVAIIAFFLTRSLITKMDILFSSGVYIFGFLFFSVVSAVFLIQTNVFIASRNSKYILYQIILSSGLSIILLVFLSHFLLAYGIFYSWGLSQFLALMICMFFFTQTIVPGFKMTWGIQKDVIKEIFTYSIGNYFQILINSLPALLFPLIILSALSPEDSAYFYFSFTIANVLFMISGAISTSLFAEGSHNPKLLSSNIKNAITHAYSLLIPAIIIIILFGNYILLLFGKSYSTNGYALLCLLSISSLFVTINSFYIISLRIQFRIKELLYLTIFSSAAILIVSLYFLQVLNMGITSVGIAYIIVNFIIALYILSRWKKELQINPSN